MIEQMKSRDKNITYITGVKKNDGVFFILFHRLWYRICDGDRNVIQLTEGEFLR